ncbi:GntR family transcriptional regulator [Oceanisphaera profunda]|uniref:GntR family transcriptional regulator n=1 Tax=Oceanisphaera profunda TaxID=1416627 RepID=A0A1Y0D4T9_9GAMM|nr:GntR family transcriptional regulator [Oceanisphaera profunda]ART82552.1 GntR family transcriptional regulator [Oceanisphaera profunda]
MHITRTQFVADAIRRQILQGVIKGGAALRQDALAKEFNVSRIPVREALLTLEAEGLVEFEAHKGAYATELSAPKILELFELRVLLECHILAAAIPKLTTEQLDDAQELLIKLDHLLDTSSQIDHWSDHNFAFHRALYEAADKPETMALITHLNTQSDRYVRIHLLHAAGVQKAEAEHGELLALCRTGDITAACDLLRRHILFAADDIVGLLHQQQQQDC